MEHPKYSTILDKKIEIVTNHKEIRLNVNLPVNCTNLKKKYPTKIFYQLSKLVDLHFIKS